MKNENAGSPKALPPVPELVGDAIHDFLYVDRERVSALYAQLFPQGTLTSVKTHSQQTSGEDSNVGTDIKVFKAESKSTDSSTEGIEHSFDTSWSIPIEVLWGLQERGLIRSKLMGNLQLGVIVLADGFLRIIDYSSMRDLWEPIVKQLPSDGSIDSQNLIALLKNLPYAIHMHVLTSEGYLWASLDANNLTVPTTDITLKHGGSISGSWKVLYMLDAFPDSGNAPEGWSAGEATNGVLNAIHALRMQIGRPADWFGITPLMIFREIPRYTPQTSLELKPGEPIG